MACVCRRCRTRTLRHVRPQQEPDDFDHVVRIPGNAHLVRLRSQGKRLQFRPLWNEIYDEFHRVYGGLCAYTCFYLPERATIDHFRPKAAFPFLAYEWNNYRLSSPRTNQFKSKRDGILDPFLIQENLFALNLPSCLISVRNELAPELAETAVYTINVLKLNDDDYLVQRRLDLIQAFVGGDISRAYLQKMNPFIFDEITRQGLWNSLDRLLSPP